MTKAGRLTLTLIVLVIFSGYLILNLEQFKLLLHLNWYLLLVIAIGYILNIASSGLFTKIILKPFNKHIAMKESVYVSLISSVGNFFAPAGAGFAFRAAYLKKRHNLQYSDYIATLYGNYIIVFLVNALFGLVALYLLREKGGSQLVMLAMIFGGIFCVSLILSLVKIPSKLLERDMRNKYVGKIAKILLQMLDGWNNIVANRKLMAKLTLLIICNFALSMLLTKAEVAALHLTIGFPALILFTVLSSLSLFVSITPANLGVKEAIYVFSASVIGFSTPEILSISLVDRGTLFLVLVILWLTTSRMRLSKDMPAPVVKSKE